MDDLSQLARAIAELIIAFIALCTFIQNWRLSLKVAVVDTKVDEVHTLTNSMKDQLVSEVRESASKNGLAAGIVAGLEKGKEMGLKEAQDLHEAEERK